MNWYKEWQFPNNSIAFCQIETKALLHDSCSYSSGYDWYVLLRLERHAVFTFLHSDKL